MNIYQIQNEYQLIINEVINNEGEITPEQITALEINKADLETKGINYAYVIKQLDADCDAIDLEVKRLSALKKVRSNTSERLKNTISYAMQLFEVEEIKTPLIKLNFRNSESVEITNEEVLADKFLVSKTTVIPDKKAIKDAIKNGEVVEGAVISYNKNLQIK
jgi:hypothetical protein